MAKPPEKRKGYSVRIFTKKGGKGFGETAILGLGPSHFRVAALSLASALAPFLRKNPTLHMGGGI